MLSSATSSDWLRFQSAPSCSSGWQRSFYVRLKKFLPPLPRPRLYRLWVHIKNVWQTLAPADKAVTPEKFQICRVFVAFSGLILAYKNEKAHDSNRVFNGQSWVFLGALEGTRIPGPLIKRAYRAEHFDFETFEFALFLCKASWFSARQFLHPLSYFASQSAHCIPWNRALTLGQMTNDDFWSMTWWRFEWPQR